MEELYFRETPKLKEPYLVMGLGGWLNAAEVSTGAVQYLVRTLKAQPLAEIDPEEFYDFSALRPVATIEEGVLKSLEFISNTFYYWKNEQGEHDLLFFLGMEPNLQWHHYADLVIEVIERFGVKRVYTVGGFYDAVPHTRQTRITGSASSSQLREELKAFNLEFRTGSYRGPTGIIALLRQACLERNIEIIGLSGRSPYYVKTTNPKVCYALLVKLTAMLGLDVDLESARMAGEYMDEMVDRALGQNADLRQYVETLEKAYDTPETTPQLPPEPSEKIIREVEEFLRQERQGNQGKS